MNKIVKNTLILTLITVIAGVLLGAVYEVTQDSDCTVTGDSQRKKHGRQYFQM